MLKSPNETCCTWWDWEGVLSRRISITIILLLSVFSWSWILPLPLSFLSWRTACSDKICPGVHTDDWLMPGNRCRCADLMDHPLVECSLPCWTHCKPSFPVLMWLQWSSSSLLQPDHMVSPDWDPTIYLSICHQFLEVLTHDRLQSRLDSRHNCQISTNKQGYWKFLVHRRLSMAVYTSSWGQITLFIVIESVVWTLPDFRVFSFMSAPWSPSFRIWFPFGGADGEDWSFKQPPSHCCLTSLDNSSSLKDGDRCLATWTVEEVAPWRDTA